MVVDAGSREWEARRQRYLRQRGALEEEQEQAARQDRMQLERNERMLYELDRKIDELHRYAQHWLAEHGGEADISPHAAINNSVDFKRKEFQNIIQYSAEVQQRRRQEYARKLDDLEHSYYRESQ